MIKALWNLTDENGQLWAQERWTWMPAIPGYKIEIRYFQGTDERDFVEASQMNRNKIRVLIESE